MTRRDEIQEILKKLLSNNLSGEQERLIFDKCASEPYSSYDFVEDYCMDDINSCVNNLIESERQRIKPLVECLEKLLSRFNVESSSYGFVKREDLTECRQALTEAKKIWGEG